MVLDCKEALVSVVLVDGEVMYMCAESFVPVKKEGGLFEQINHDVIIGQRIIFGFKKGLTNKA